MSTKKTIIFHHLGFPIKLISCPHILVEGELVPDVDYEQLEELMFRVLPLKPTRLTGAELKFIRHHLGKLRRNSQSGLRTTSTILLSLNGKLRI